MVIAVMDLGTNTFHLLIARIIKEKPEIIFEMHEPVKLGENGISSRFISEAPFKRAIVVLRKFKNKLLLFKPKRTIAIGTAAIRNASNKKLFLSAIKKETGIRVKVISGLEEARFIYEGVKHAMDLGDKINLLMDIGGGSVEFILADKNQIYWHHSFKTGAALLLEKFKPSDPISPAELNSIFHHLEKEFTPLKKACKKWKPESLVGSSGAFETFFEMLQLQKPSHSIHKNRTSFRLSITGYRRLHEVFIKSTMQERKKMKGLVAMRVDMIVIASIMLTFVLEKFKLQHLCLSTYALKEGILWNRMRNSGDGI